MNFESQHSLVNEWLRSNPGVKLLYADESSSCFQFVSDRPELSSFCVTCPITCSGKWSVSSDVDKVMPSLSSAKAYLNTTTNKDLQKLLNCITVELPLSVTSDESIGATDEEDDEDVDEYCFPDEDFDDEQSTKFEESSVQDNMQCFATNGSPLAVNRLLRDMKQLQKAEGKFGLSGSPRDNNLFVWDVQLTDFPQNTQLGKDLESYAKKYKRKPIIEMEMLFPEQYPLSPPFVRILQPRFEMFTGHVTVGGSICMEVLTKSGWSPGNDIESVLVQIRATIMSDSNARLAFKNTNTPYSMSEAKDAFDRMVARYGWK